MSLSDLRGWASLALLGSVLALGCGPRTTSGGATGRDVKDLPPPPAGHTRHSKPDSRHGTTRQLGQPTREMEPATVSKYESVYEPKR
jgi:hypothetical protein